MTKAHLARAALEGVAFEIYDLAQAMAQDIGKPMPMFRVDGGMSANDLLMQFQADLLQTPLERPRMIETTALGAAFLAGLGTGMWAGVLELKSAWRAGTFVGSASANASKRASDLRPVATAPGISPALLPLLRRYWKLYQLKSWLFPGPRITEPITRAGVAHICSQAGDAAKLTKDIYPHLLRHNPAYLLMSCEA